MGFFSIIIMVVYMDKNVEDYLDYLSYKKGYSKYTIKNYEEDIIEFINYCERENISYLDIEYNDIRFYLMYLKDDKKNKHSSIDRKLSSLRGFFKYLSVEK